jgi:hypothetical protein
VRLTLLYISSEAVIPAKAGIQIENTGFRVKPGMTIKAKGLLTQYTRTFNFNIWLLDFELSALSFFIGTRLLPSSLLYTLPSIAPLEFRGR